MRRYLTPALCALCAVLAASPAESAGPPLGVGPGNGNGNSGRGLQAAAQARLKQSAAIRTRNAAAASSAGAGSQPGGVTNRGGAALRNRLKSRFDLRAAGGRSAAVRANAEFGLSTAAGNSSGEQRTVDQSAAGAEPNSGNVPAGQSGTRPASRAEVALRNRLAAIDRMRDFALESGDLQLLERADRLEARARAQFQADQQASVPFGNVINANQQTSGDIRLTGREFGQAISAQAREFGSEFGAATSGLATEGGSEFGLQNRMKNAVRIFPGEPEPETETDPTSPNPAPEEPESTPESPAAEPDAPLIEGEVDAAGEGTVTLEGIE